MDTRGPGSGDPEEIICIFFWFAVRPRRGRPLPFWYLSNESMRPGKRLATLEARYSAIDAACDRWPSMDCDPKRRLKRYAAYFEGRSWGCIGTPERKAKNVARLA